MTKAFLGRRIWDRKSPFSYGIAFLTGVLIALSLPPWGWWPLQILGLVIWLALLFPPSAVKMSDSVSGRISWLDRLIVSGVVSAGWFGLSLFWIVDLTIIGYLAVIVIFAAMYGAGAMLTVNWHTFPAALVLVELTRSRWPFGGVPVSTLAMGLVDSVFSHITRLGGQLLMVFTAAALAAGIFMLLRACFIPGFYRLKSAGGSYVAAGGLTILGVILFTVFSGFAPTTSPTGENLHTAIVQGGGPQRVRARDSNPREVFERHLTASQRLITQPVELIVWPENVLDVRSFEGSREEAELKELAAAQDALLYAGVVEDFDEDTFLNYSVLLSPEGEQLDLYEKVRRVPFGEFVPFRSILEPFAPSFLPDTEARVGNGPPVISDGQHRFGTVISWEVFFEDRTRAAARQDVELIINPTNNSTYWLGIVQAQQIASSKLRAMETGLWVVQAAPTGYSAFVDSSGAVRARTGIGEQAVLQMSVELRQGKTLAVRLGVWYLAGTTLALLAAAWLVEGLRLKK